MEEKNILDQLSKTAEEPAETDKKESTNNKQVVDDEVIQSMMANGDNTKGMFEPDEKAITDKNEKLHEDQDDKAKVKTKGDAEPSDKYKEKFMEDMQKNPDKYFVQTPRGKMSLKEANEKGFDPRTKRFNLHERQQKNMEKVLSQVNDKDREGIQRLLDPSQLNLAPADAEGLGLRPDSKMIRRSNQEQSQIPMQDQQQGTQAPAGQPDIAALLGGR